MEILVLEVKLYNSLDEIHKSGSEIVLKRVSGLGYWSIETI